MKHLAISCWFCVLATILASTYGQVEPYRQKYCGKRFADTLFAICTPRINKKDPMDYRYNYPDYFSDEYNDLSTYLSLFRPKRMLELRSPFALRKRQKATTECCANSCTLEQLLQYCASYDF